MPSSTASAAAFADLDDFVALPRVNSLTMAPDGSRLIVGVSALSDDATSYSTALWDVDPAGRRPARRLTRGTRGESGAALTREGDLLFVAKRAHGKVSEDDAKPAVWLLPATGGEPRQVATRPGGVSAVVAAPDADAVIVVADTLPAATDDDAEQRLREARKEGKVSAILHTGYPIRYWDHDLGPGYPRLFGGRLRGGGADAGEDEWELRDLTPDIGPGLVETGMDLSRDGATIVTGVEIAVGMGESRRVLERIDVASAQRVRILDDPEADLGGAVISPDGQLVAYVRMGTGTPERASTRTLWVAGLDGSHPRRLASSWDRWPSSLTWLPDSSGLLVVADDRGRAPIFRVLLDGGEPERITAEDAAFSEVSVAPDGSVAFALCTSYAFPPEPVRVDLSSGEVTVLAGPTERPEVPGTLREVEAQAEDGTPLRAWLALPAGASERQQAPLVLWIHGGPLSSWNAWSWRWCPWLLVAQGYAVLLPDPALSTGYGQEFVQRGWAAWGHAPYTDLMAITDVAEGLDEIDAERTAAMGGSFGGYMANWVAGHTDRFRAVVTHASLWAIDSFGYTTDIAYHWAREMTPQMALENSPHRFVDQIRTPMLVVHGDKDYRVPIGEGLRLWYELLSASGLPADRDGNTVHRFLYFPDENHWVLTPQHAKIWYQVVLAFLGEHVCGEPAAYPDVLG